MRRRGTSLIMVLGMATAALLLVFAAANVSVFNLQFSTAMDRREHARNLAESAINLAIAKMAEDDSYGVSRAPGQDISYPGQGFPGKSRGYLTFNKSQADALGIHFSTNNPTANQAVGDDRSLPAYSAQLVGFGECGEVRVQLECIFHHPPFPKGLAVTGKGQLNGVTLLGLAPGATFSGNWNTVPETDQRPANVFSNSTAPDALTLDKKCNISGGLASCGTIKIDPGAVVGGEVRAHADPQDVATFQASVMLDRLEATIGLINWAPGTVLEDFTVRPGDLVVNQDIELEGGVLGVRGNLKLVGGATIRGRGAVIVGGDVEMAGGANLEAGRQCAVVANGKVRLISPDSDKFYFQGLVYSGQKIEAAGVTVVGAVICHSDTPGKGDAVLDNVRIIESPVQVQGRQGLPWARTLGAGSEKDGGDSSLFRFYSIPDPANPGQFLIYGKAEYSMSPVDKSTGLPGRTMAAITVVWTPPLNGVPGHSHWHIIPGAYVGDLSYVPTSDQPYDGKPATLTANLKTLFRKDVSNPSYFGEVQGLLDNYLSSLQGAGDKGHFLEFNLNRLMAPGEDSRVLFVREL